MSEDIIKRRQLLREKLEGKQEDNKNSKPITVVKSSRLHIPTIFQNGSQENLFTQQKLPVQKAISKSTGNLHKESSFKLTNIQDNHPPIKPPRKNKSREDLSETNAQSLPSISSTNIEDQNFFASNENPEEVPYSEPVIVAMRKKPLYQEENREKNAQSAEILLRRKMSDLKNTRNSLEVTSTYFDFTEKSSNPKSPTMKTLDKIPSLKRSGSRAGFIVEDELKKQQQQQQQQQQQKQEKKIERSVYNDGEGLYDNLKLRNKSVKQNEDTGKEDCNNNENLENILNEVLYENLDVLRANKFYSKKIMLGPVGKAPIPNKRYEKPKVTKRSLINI